MADRIELFDVTVPAGTLEAAPQTTALPFNLGVVTDIEILVPPGPSGLVGFRIQHSQETVIPYNKSKWVIADDDTLRWPLSGFPVGSAWALQAYNRDVYPHTLYLRFLVNETGPRGPVTVPIVPIAPVAPSEPEPTTEEVA